MLNPFRSPNLPFSAMIILERLDKRLWVQTVKTLVRKLCSEGKVGIAALFFYRLLHKDRNVDRLTFAEFDIREFNV